METMRIPKFTWGERLAKAREDEDITQEQMGELLEVSKSTIAKWESDRGQPRDFLKVMRQWSEITKVPMWWLLEYGEEQVFTKRGNSTPRNRTGPSRGRLGGTAPAGVRRPAYKEAA